jgi:putative PIN family toxin of toxin-antitoxin system
VKSHFCVVAIIDTNVVVSGVLTSELDAPTRLILDGMLDRRFTFLLSGDLLAEYRSVLLRPKVRKLHGLNNQEVDEILTEIAANAVVRDPEKLGVEPPDKGDRHLWRLLETFDDTILVTGDRDLLDSPQFAGRIVRPREFLERDAV